MGNKDVNKWLNEVSENWRNNNLKPKSIQEEAKETDIDPVEETMVVSDYVMRKTRNYENIVNNDVSVKDEDWVFDSFLVPRIELDPIDELHRYWSITETKFTDTSLGGNIAINVYPQFTRYADIRLKGRLSNRNDVRVNNISGNIGMGRYYGEVIDDNAFDVYFTFGVPEFNSLFTFILNSMDYKQSVVANEGRSPFMYNLGQIWGLVAVAAGFGIVGIAVTVLRKVVSTVYDIVAGPGRFSYYYLKPTMFMYWSTVNSLVTMMATELGLVTPSLMPSNKDNVGVPIKLDKKDTEFLREYMPDIITKDNYIDVFNMVTKTQRLYNEMHKKELELYENINNITSVSDNLGKELLKISDNVKNRPSDFFERVRKSTKNSKWYGFKQKEETNNKDTNTTKPSDKQHITYDKDGTIKRSKEDDPSFINEVFTHYRDMMQGGAAYAVFRVENPGSVSESFSNETGDIELEGMLKSIGGKAKALQYDLAGGVVPGMGDLLKGIKDFASGALDMITFGLSNVLTALLGNANMDMPKRWIDSSASFPEHTFKMRLQAPYGNPISQLRNIYIPLAAILAAALPKAAGPSSYTSPFLCSMFIRGYNEIKLGMITNLTITRGVSNLPFNKQRRPLAIDVTFTVTDFSKILAMPVVTEIGQEAFTSFNEDSPINKYIATLCARDLYTSKFFIPKMKLNFARFKANMDMMFSSSYAAAKLYDATPDILKDALERKAVNYTEHY